MIAAAVMVPVGCLQAAPAFSAISGSYSVGLVSAGSANGINAGSEVVGQTADGYPMYNNASGSHTLTTFAPSAGGTVGISSGIAAAVNTAGLAVGSAVTTADASTTYGFTANTALASPVMNQIPSFGGSATFANAINDSGVVVGSSQYASTNGFAFQYTSGSTLTPLDPSSSKTGLNGSGAGVSSEANGINAGGSIVGDATAPDNTQHAFFYSSSKMYDLGVGGSASIARAINTGGVIVGNITNSDTGEPEAFSYSNYSTAAGSTTTTNGDTILKGTTTLLDPTGIYASTDAEAINTAGAIVGDAVDNNGNDLAFLYQPGGSITDLNTLISDPDWQLQTATGINDSGDITGTGIYTGPSGTPEQAVFLLVPTASVPEPVSILTTGMVGVWSMVRRRRLAR